MQGFAPRPTWIVIKYFVYICEIKAHVPSSVFLHVILKNHDWIFQHFSQKQLWEEELELYVSSAAGGEGNISFLNTHTLFTEPTCL